MGNVMTVAQKQEIKDYYTERTQPRRLIKLQDQEINAISVPVILKIATAVAATVIAVYAVEALYENAQQFVTNIFTNVITV